MTRHAFTIALLAVTAAAAPARADNIDFGQFGPNYSVSSSPLTGTTSDGVAFTLVGPGNFQRLDQGNGWAGTFQPGRKLLYTGNNPGQMVFYFATPLSSLNTIAAQANLYGAYTATLNAFSLGVLVASSSYSGVAGNNPGTISGFAVSGYFDTVTISTTNDDWGFAVGGTYSIAPPPVGGVPEPASWAMLIAGFGLVGSMQRRQRAVTA